MAERGRRAVDVRRTLMSLIVVTGLAAEARIAVSTDTPIIGAGRASRLSRDLDAAIASGARRLLSFGVAGALVPQLRSGDLILAHGVRDGQDALTCDPDWRRAMSRRLRLSAGRTRHDEFAPAQCTSSSSALFRFDRKAGWRSLIDIGTRYPVAEIAGSDAPVADDIGKTALFAATGAIAVDMESVIVARAAQRHGLPFAVLRVVADPSHRELPSAALVAMRADGEVDVGSVLMALMRDLSQVPTLMSLALDARRAFSALAHARAILGPDFASLDPDELRSSRREKSSPRQQHSPALGSAIRGYAHDMA
jgi:adenosylhomocysteine nucleosidase